MQKILKSKECAYPEKQETDGRTDRQTMTSMITSGPFLQCTNVGGSPM